MKTALGVASALLLIAGVALAWARQPVAPLTVDDAITAFRTTGPTTTTAPAPPPVATTAPTPAAASRSATAPRPTPQPAATAAPSTAATRRPQEGVYVFDTNGHESTNALGGARHDYPAQTAWTVRNNPCGYTIRWQPLQERWDESELCTGPDGGGVKRFSTFHSFFQRTDQRDYLCNPPGLVDPVTGDPGRTWTWGCTSNDGSIATRVSIVGIEPVNVGGRTVQTRHIRYESTMTGSSEGTQIQDRWQGVDVVLTIRMTNHIDAQVSSPFGRVHYEEEYRLDLTSLEPRR